MHKVHPLAWQSEPTDFATTHCMKCEAGFTRKGTDGGQGHHLSYRPGAGVPQYDRLRSLRAQGGEAPGSEARSAPHSASPGAEAPSSSLAGELAAAKGYYASRIAAARQSLSPAELAAAIQAIQNEQTLATRAIIDRWQVYFQNREQRPPQNPGRPSDARPLLRYTSLRKS